jgi:hypothetical protein
MKVEQSGVQVDVERGSVPMFEPGAGIVLAEQRQYLVPPDTHRIEPGVFLRVRGVLDLEPKPIFTLDNPTDHDDLELQMDVKYRGARRIGLPRKAISKKEEPPPVDVNKRVVSAKVADQEDDMWFERDRQLHAEGNLTEVFGRIEAEQFLGRALIPEEPARPLGLFFDYDKLWGNTPPSIGKKMHLAGIPQTTLVKIGK